MRELENYINRIHKWVDNTWLFEGDGLGDFEKTTDKIPHQVLLKNYLKDLRQQAEYVKELLEKSA